MKLNRKMLNVCSVALLMSGLAAGMAQAAAGPTRLRAPRTYPLVIDAPGSYVLTENLTVPTADSDAISITASNVTLDLGGFVVSGPVSCTGIPTVCSPAGSGFGIFTSGSAGNTTIRNGTVSGMGREGIHITVGIVERVRAISNGEFGIVGSGCVIRDSIASQNGLDGISANSCVVTNNVAIFNGGAGIQADAGPITANVANNNGAEGITSQGTPSGSAAIHENAAVANDGSGIAGDIVTAVGNVSYANDGYGITGGGGVGFAFNVANSNTLGETFSGNELASNVCGLDMTCP